MVKAMRWGGDHLSLTSMVYMQSIVKKDLAPFAVWHFDSSVGLLFF